MSTTEATAAAEQKDTDKRQEFVTGLRDLADFIEQNEDAPTPGFVIADRGFYYGSTAGDFIAAAKALAGEPVIDGTRVKVTRLFGPVKFSIDISANEICQEREVTSTAFVLPPELDDLQRAAVQDDPRGEADR